MVAISDAIKSFDPDIVALQEVGGYSQAEFLAKQVDLNFVYISHHRPAKGFAILSKHLISDVKNEAFLP